MTRASKMHFPALFFVQKLTNFTSFFAIFTSYAVFKFENSARKSKKASKNFVYNLNYICFNGTKTARKWILDSTVMHASIHFKGPNTPETTHSSKLADCL